MATSPAVSADLSPAADFQTAFSGSEYSKDYDWTGPFFGVQGGVIFGDIVYQNTDADDAIISDDPTGGFVGLRVGIDRQYGRAVFGLFGDVELVSLDGSGEHPDFDDFAEFSIDWLAAVGGRIGRAFDRTLVYALAGVGFTELGHTYSGCCVDVSYPDESMVGWTVGLGLERLFGDRWSGFVEWRYYDFGSVDVEERDGIVDHRLDLKLNLVKAGLLRRW